MMTQEKSSSIFHTGECPSDIKSYCRAALGRGWVEVWVALTVLPCSDWAVMVWMGIPAGIDLRSGW